MLWNILQYEMTLSEDIENPDQTAQMRRVIWALAVCIPESLLHKSMEGRYRPVRGSWRAANGPL